MRSTTLVTAQTLAQNLADPAWRIFDCRHDLKNPALGAQQYAGAHIPGAQFAHLDRDLSAPKTGSNGRHPLPSPEAIAQWLGEQGIRPQDQIIAYDTDSGTMAARLWWTLRWIGHEAVAVLDGGYARWVEEGYSVNARVPEHPRTTYPLRQRPNMTVEVAQIESRTEDENVLLLDARSPTRHRGESEPIDPVAGRIPGSHNRFCAQNLDGDGLFKDAGTLRQEFAVLLGKRSPEDVVHYCGSGVAACHNQLAMEIAGFTGSRLYAGSWSEWIADPRRPREKG